jgi:hypothetical protein
MHYGVHIPAVLHVGGIIGQVRLVDVVTQSTSKWFSGPYGWVLRDPQFLPFKQCPGQPGLFNVGE